MFINCLPGCWRSFSTFAQLENIYTGETNGPSVVYAVAVNCLYKDRVSRVRVRDMDRVSGRVTDRVRFRV